MFFQKIKTALMEFEWHRLAPLSLILGAIAIVFAGGAYYSNQFQFSEWTYIPLAVGAILILLAIFLDPEGFQGLFTGRQAGNSRNVTLMFIALVGILVVINYIVKKEGDARNWWTDLTENKSQSLSVETIQTLAVLKDPVEARLFFDTRNPSGSGLDSAKKLLDDYAAKSNGKLTYKVIDPYTDPQEWTSNNVTQAGTAVLAIGSRQEKVSSVTETELTSALLRLTFPGERKIYFLTGHQEGKPNEPGDTNYSQLVTLIKAKNYTVDTLNLINGKIPDDAKAIVIAGPHAPLIDSELTALQDYWKKGGGIILLQSPAPLTKMDATKDIFAGWLASEFGISLQNDVIYDTMDANFPTIAIATQIDPANPITQNVSQFLVFPSVQSISVKAPAKTTLAYSSLVQVGIDMRTWGETDMTSMTGDNKPANDSKTDHAAPLTVAVAVNDPTTKAHLVVVGSADFAADKYIQAYANSDLIVNSIDWSSGMASMVNLTPKLQTPRTILPPYPWVTSLAFLTTGCLLPLVFAIAGLIVFVVRRRQK
jgi:ABC-type uncharacterized transport system involved in gliding motility auxiliary subunit